MRSTRIQSVLILFLLQIVACSPESPSRAVEWYPSIPLAIEAHSEGQPVFVYFSASWCRICHRMDNEVLQDPLVLSALEGYSLVTIDIDRQATTAAAFQVLAVPAFVVLDGKRRVRARSTGFQAKEDLVQTLVDLRKMLQEEGSAATQG